MTTLFALAEGERLQCVVFHKNIYFAWSSICEWVQQACNSMLPSAVYPDSIDFGSMKAKVVLQNKDFFVFKSWMFSLENRRLLLDLVSPSKRSK